MSISFLRLGIAAAALFTTVLSGPAVLAQTADRGALPEKHESNTLKKLGKAVQYPVRKAGENVSKSTRKGAKDVEYGTRKNTTNLSVNAHRVTGQNSVVRRKNGHRRHNTVVTPKGHLYRLHDHK